MNNTCKDCIYYTRIHMTHICFLDWELAKLRIYREVHPEQPACEHFKKKEGKNDRQRKL